MTFPNLWREYVDLLNKMDGEHVEMIEESDTAYLTRINAHPDIIEAAKIYAGVHDGALNLYWGMPEKFRKWAPDFFKGAMPIGDDGCGNYFVWLDPADINSNILFLCHDPAIVVVAANSINELLEGMMAGINSPTYHELEEGPWGNYCENAGIDEMLIWNKKFYNGENDNLGLKVVTKDGLTHFDFSKALRGAGVSLVFNGKNTKVEYSKNPGILLLSVMSKNDIKARRNRDLRFYCLLAVIFSVLTLYNLSLEKSVLKSIGHSILWVFCGCFVYATALGLWCDFKERHKEK